MSQSCPDNSCCEAFNDAVAAYQVAANDQFVSGLNTLGLLSLGPDRNARISELGEAYHVVSAAILAAFARTQETECKQSCCVFTANAVRDLGTSTIQTLANLILNEGLQSVPVPPSETSELHDQVILVESELGLALEAVYNNIGCPTPPPVTLPPPPTQEQCFRHPDNTCYNCFIPKYHLECPTKFCRPEGRCESSSSSSDDSCSKNCSSSHKKKHRKNKKQPKPVKEDSSDSESDSSTFKRLNKKVAEKEKVDDVKTEPKLAEDEKKSEKTKLKKVDDDVTKQKKKPAKADASFKRRPKKAGKKNSNAYEYSYDNLRW